MAFAKRGMQSSASIALNYLETSSSLGWNGLTISRVNPYRVAQPSATSWARHKCIRCMPTTNSYEWAIDYYNEGSPSAYTDACPDAINEVGMYIWSNVGDLLDKTLPLLA